MNSDELSLNVKMERPIKQYTFCPLAQLCLLLAGTWSLIIVTATCTAVSVTGRHMVTYNRDGRLHSCVCDWQAHGHL